LSLIFKKEQQWSDRKKMVDTSFSITMFFVQLAEKDRLVFHGSWSDPIFILVNKTHHCKDAEIETIKNGLARWSLRIFPDNIKLDDPSSFDSGPFSQNAVVKESKDTLCFNPESLGCTLKSNKSIIDVGV
jgi:hypothetical protein